MDLQCDRRSYDVIWTEYIWCISTLQITTVSSCELTVNFRKISNILKTPSQVTLMSNLKMFDFIEIDMTIPLTNIYVSLSPDERKYAGFITQV